MKSKPGHACIFGFHLVRVRIYGSRIRAVSFLIFYRTLPVAGRTDIRLPNWNSHSEDREEIEGRIISSSFSHLLFLPSRSSIVLFNYPETITSRTHLQLNATSTWRSLSPLPIFLDKIFTSASYVSF